MSDPTNEPVDPWDRKVAARYTPMLRGSEEPRWERLRRKLEEVGVTATDAAIGTLFPDDVRLEFGVVVARDGRCFSFDFDFRRDAEGKPNPPPADATIGSWEQLGSHETTSTYARAVGAARELLGQESSS